MYIIDFIFQLLVLLFFGLFCVWLFLKLRNLSLIRQLDCAPVYRQLQQDFKRRELPTNLFKTTIVLCSVFGIYFGLGLAASIIWFMLAFITLGGIAYYEAGGDPSFYNNLILYINQHFSLFPLVGLLLIIALGLLLIRSIYISTQIHHTLTDNRQLAKLKRSIPKSAKPKPNHRDAILLILIIIGWIIFLFLRGAIRITISHH